MTIGTPMVFFAVLNDHWCTNRHMSTQSASNTQSRFCGRYCVFYQTFCAIVRSEWSYPMVLLPTLRSVISGVPQGSVLGPILFLIYINDIVDLFSNSDVSTKLFADDIKTYLELTSEADYSTLQKSINKIFDWSKTWKLKLANDKCQHNHNMIC